MIHKKINKNRKKYPIDSGGIIHMASLKKWYSNTFRITVTMKEKVNKNILQESFNNIRERFPTIVAGIRKGIFSYYIVPVSDNVDIEYDKEVLKPFTNERIKTCAMKVLYNDNSISVEIFHSLTDGSGGAVFLKTLIARYIELNNVEEITYTEEILDYLDDVKENEISDDYVLNSSGIKAKANKDIVYKIPGECNRKDKYQVIVHKVKTNKLLEKAHEYNTSLTTYLTAAMAESIFDIQEKYKVIKDCNKERCNTEDIQIMVPINLRKRFNSNTLYNFSLYALPKYNIEDKEKTFEELIERTSDELRKQFTIENLRNMMTINAYAQNTWIIKYMPLIIKEKILRIVYKMYGERNSCISVSNFGEISFGEKIDKYVEDVEFILTPRRNASYNCSLVSFNGNTNISISKRGKGCNLEEMFFGKLKIR